MASMLSETQRVKFVENSLDHFFEVVEQDGLSERFHGLFVKFGIDAFFDYTFDRNNYEAVTVHDGKIDAESVIDDGKVPVVMLYPSERVEITTGLHPLQAQPLEASVITQRSVINPGAHTSASLYTPVGTEELPGETIVHRGGPLITYNFYRELQKQGRTCSSVVAHENTHLAQLLANAPRRYPTTTNLHYSIAKDTLVDELQAYSVQSVLWDRVVGRDLEPLVSIEVAKQVDAIRSRVQGDRYEASEAVIRALRANIDGRLILPPALLKAA